MSNRVERHRRAGLLALVAGLAPMLLAPSQGFGHAAELSAQVRTAVEVRARYDTGAPMAAAQVTVFAPDDPASPWLRGSTDEAGRFVFVPGEQAGHWSVRVRQAGHGAMVHLDLSAEADVTAPLLAASVPSGPDALQRLVMAASVVWGCIGTALYFRRRGT